MLPDSGSRLARARHWFAAQGRQPFEFQESLWQAYWAGESGLLNAGTGTGKTLAAWMGPLLESDEPGAGIRVIWLTPLRALASDLLGALQAPLAEVGLPWRVEVRTGDTSSSLRAKQRRSPPHALITTPESLSLLLTYADMIPALRDVQALIVDEWHEFLGTKRGVQLELCAARLRGLAPRLRIWGLSATLPDLNAALRTLLGPGRPGRIIRAPESKRYVIDAVLPTSTRRFPWAGHLGLVLLPQVVERVAAARSTLIFTNTRSQAEIWYHAVITARLDWLTTTALHHGSIDSTIRRRVEAGIKDGTLRCVVCTSSLDLGVDFPPVEQVLQIGSPKGVARLLQRAGRSGHRPGDVSRISIVPTHVFELVECAAARNAAAKLDVEPRVGLTLALDVLAQHLVSLAVGAGFEAEPLLAEVRGTHAFAPLTDTEWRWTLDFITRGGTALQGYPQFRRVSLIDGLYRMDAPDLARDHRQAVGTITSNASMAVKWVSGGTLGFVEESFLSKLKQRDVFLFGGRTLALARIRDSVAYVRTASAKNRFVPRWQGARMPLSPTLGHEVLAILEHFDDHAATATATATTTAPELELLRPILALQREWSAVPTRTHLLIETLANREGFHLFIFPFAGRTLNEGVASLLASRAARDSPRTFSITTNEYGFELLCEEPLPIDQTTLRRWLRPDDLLEDLVASVNLSDLARRQFREIARIAGLVHPGRPTRAKSARQLQASSGLMFDVLSQHDPENLLLEQARREVLEAQLSFTAMRTLLERMAAQTLLLRNPPRLTPLSFPLWADRLQTHMLSTETWTARVDREARRLEKAAP